MQDRTQSEKYLNGLDQNLIELYQRKTELKVCQREVGPKRKRWMLQS